MSTPATRRRSQKSGTKAEQDKAQREAKAEQAAPAPAPADEASEAELAAQKDRPSNDQPADTENGPSADEAPGESDPAPAEAEADMEIGAVVTLPTISRSSTKGSVWTDRLNDAAEKIEAAGFPENASVPVLACATPRTAANTANNVRRKIKEGKIGGLLDGTFDVVTRGRTILVQYKK